MNNSEPICQHPKEAWEVDRARGQTTCSLCGNVISQTAYEMDPQFARGDGGGAGGGGGGGGGGGAGGLRLAGVNARPPRARAAQHGAHGAHRPSTEQALRQMTAMARKMNNISQAAIDSAAIIYRQAINANAIVGARNAVLCACMYIACRKARLPHTVLDFSDECREPPWAILAYVRQICKLTHIETPSADASFYVARFADALELKELSADIQLYALKVLRAMKDDWIATGRRPLGVCAAAVLVACRAYGVQRSETDFARLSRLTWNTVVYHVEEFAATPAAQLTDIDEYRPSSGVTVPTCFSEGRKHDKEIEDKNALLNHQTDFYTLVEEARNNTPITASREQLWKRFIFHKARIDSRLKKKQQLQKKQQQDKKKSKTSSTSSSSSSSYVSLLASATKKQEDDNKDEDENDEDDANNNNNNNTKKKKTTTKSQNNNQKENNDDEKDEQEESSSLEIDAELLDIHTLSSERQLEILGVPVHHHNRSSRQQSVTSGADSAVVVGSNQNQNQNQQEKVSTLSLGSTTNSLSLNNNNNANQNNSSQSEKLKIDSSLLAEIEKIAPGLELALATSSLFSSSSQTQNQQDSNYNNARRSVSSSAAAAGAGQDGASSYHGGVDAETNLQYPNSETTSFRGVSPQNQNSRLHPHHGHHHHNHHHQSHHARSLLGQDEDDVATLLGGDETQKGGSRHRGGVGGGDEDEEELQQQQQQKKVIDPKTLPIRKAQPVLLDISENDSDTDEYLVMDNEERIRNEKNLRTVLQAKFNALTDGFKKAAENADKQNQNGAATPGGGGRRGANNNNNNNNNNATMQGGAQAAATAIQEQNISAMHQHQEEGDQLDEDMDGIGLGENNNNNNHNQDPDSLLLDASSSGAGGINLLVSHRRGRNNNINNNQNQNQQQQVDQQVPETAAEATIRGLRGRGAANLNLEGVQQLLGESAAADASSKSKKNKKDNKSKSSKKSEASSNVGNNNNNNKSNNSNNQDDEFAL